jgi:hypothetical protein
MNDPTAAICGVYAVVIRTKLDSTIDDLVTYLKAMEKNKRPPKTNHSN